jgi:hypothetical protein
MTESAAGHEAPLLDDTGLHATDAPIDLSVYRWKTG